MTIIAFDDLDALTPSPTVKIPALDGLIKGHVIASDLVGAKGDTGDTGLKGDTGEKGDTGDTGLKGDKGETGDTGPKGDTGEKGDTGDTGLKGDTGEKGDTGNAGADGQDTTLTLGAVQTGSFTAVSGFRYPIDLSAAADPSNITITLPANATGNKFAFYDQTASCTETRTATITGLIEGQAATDLLLDVQGAKIEIYYEDAVYGYSVNIR